MDGDVERRKLCSRAREQVLESLSLDRRRVSTCFL